MNKGQPINISQHDEALYAELNELHKLNTELLNALNAQKREAFPDLLDRRNGLSQKIENLSKQQTLQANEMSDETKALAAKVLMQDRELMIHLELEVQKLQGKYCKLQMLAQKRMTGK